MQHPLIGTAMDSKSLTREQADAMLAKVLPQLGYLYRLRERMERTGFPQDDRLYQCVTRAHGAMQDVRLALHYLTCQSRVGGK